MSEVVINVTKVEEVVTINATPNVTQILVNTNSGGGIQSVVAGTNITIDDTDPLNPIISASGGGGAVDSVNGQTGVVVLDADDISETATRFWLTNILKTAYDGAVTWISTNGTNILNHIASTSNPHNVTKSQVGLSNVVNADTTTTANITDSTNKRFVTDANLVVIGNTSGTNSGDNATNTTSNSYADAKVVAELASFKTANFLDFTSSGQTQLDGKSATIISSTTQVNNIAVVTEQYLQGYPILANTIPDNCVLNLLVKFFKASAGGFTLTCRVYINTTNSLVGATLIAQTTAGGAAVSDALLYRNIIIRGSNLIILSTSSTLNNDLASVLSSTPSTIAFDRSVNQFIIVSFTVPNSSINNLNSVNLTKL